MLVAGFVPSIASAVQATAVVKCAVVSPNNVPASCTYVSTQRDRQVLTAFTLRSYTLEWVDRGNHRYFACTTGSCRNEPGLAFYADRGTTVRVTVTRGIAIVREVNIGG